MENRKNMAGGQDAYLPIRYPVFGIPISASDMVGVVDAITRAAKERHPMGVSALAVHGLMEAVRQNPMSSAVRRLDIVTPDGQPVRWALNLLHGANLADRVAGPNLMPALCRRAEAEGIGIYLFGSTDETCRKLVAALKRDYPNLRISGVQPDRFREATEEEDRADIDRINASGAGIVFVGRGCPRQEYWVSAHRDQIDCPLIAVGAAFDFIAGNLTRAPEFLQRHGLEWTWRLVKEPRRLFWRYASTNTSFLLHLAAALATGTKGRHQKA